MKGIPIALQLYSVRKDCEKDLWQTLESVAEMGYEGVEFAGYYGRSAKELKKKLDDLGLKVAGTHIGLDTLLGDELEKTIKFNQILDNQFLIVPGLPEERTNSKSAWVATANLFNKIAQKLKPQGMRIGYHNHTVEFQPIAGESSWDVFFRTTAPEVIMQLDIGNAMAGGVSSDGILEIVKRFPGRAITVHLKEYSSSNKDAILGEGEMKWKELFPLCKSVGGTQWYIVEQESYAFTPLECVRRCLENFKNIESKLR